jgi:hypothetical protein
VKYGPLAHAFMPKGKCPPTLNAVARGFCVSGFHAGCDERISRACMGYRKKHRSVYQSDRLELGAGIETTSSHDVTRESRGRERNAPRLELGSFRAEAPNDWSVNPLGSLGLAMEKR